MGGGAARFAGQDPPRVRWVRGDGREMQVRGGAAAAYDFLPVRQHVPIGSEPAGAGHRRGSRLGRRDGQRQWPISHAELRS